MAFIAARRGPMCTACRRNVASRNTATWIATHMFSWRCRCLSHLGVCPLMDCLVIKQPNLLTQLLNRRATTIPSGRQKLQNVLQPSWVRRGGRRYDGGNPSSPSSARLPGSHPITRHILVTLTVTAWPSRRHRHSRELKIWLS